MRIDGYADNSIRTKRSSLRAFFHWSYKTGRTAVDPSAEPSSRHSELPPPPAWIPELAAFRSYLRGIGRTEETIRTRTNAVRRFARENPSLTPWAVTLDDLVDWMGAHRWAPETRKLHRDAFKAFYRWAVDTERTISDPASRLPVVRGGASQPAIVLDDAYALALVKADSRERLALRLGAELGLRRGEAVQVHSRDLVQTHEGWALTVHGKGRKVRQLPLTPSLATILREAPQGWAFPGGDRGHLSAAWMGHLVSQLLPVGVSMHALRHRFATRAYGVDRDVFAVQQLLGHSSPQTTQRYVRVSDSSLRRLVEAVGS
ncbi:integrase [Rathayibacter sp. AY1C4]|nr:integrase [Rathayibacter sp. AY1C4]